VQREITPPRAVPGRGSAPACREGDSRVRGSATCPRLGPGRSRARATRPRPPLHAQVSAVACGVRGRRGSRPSLSPRAGRVRWSRSRRRKWGAAGGWALVGTGGGEGEGGAEQAGDGRWQLPAASELARGRRRPYSWDQATRTPGAARPDVVRRKAEDDVGRSVRVAGGLALVGARDVEEEAEEQRGRHR